PIPVIPPSTLGASSSPATPPAKPKSRFALQREKEAADRAAAGSGTQRFELDLDGDGGALPRASPRPSLVKDILERPVSRTAPPRAPTAPGLARPSPLHAPSTGFPTSGRGVFSRKSSQLTSSPAFVEPASSESASPLAPDESVDGLLASVSQENEGVLRGMSEAQILEEQRQIREEMGLSDGILKMLQERANKREGGLKTLSSTRAKAAPAPRTRPAPAAAPAPPQSRQPEPADDDDDDGSPEYIRRHFFPNEPENPALNWMKPRPHEPRADTPTEASQLAILSFNLQGALLAEAAALHAAPLLAADHHVSSSSAFTIPSLLSLTASSVPSQRSTAFTVLHRILVHPSNHSKVIGEKEWAPDWPLCALDELLRSGISPVFLKLPAGWDASELQLVKTTLSLMRLAVEASTVGRLKAPALVYDLIKVFMLEKDNGGTATASMSAQADLFRNEAVQHSIGALLAPLSIGCQPAKQVLCSDTRRTSETLEGISSLVSSAPFYQLYTDLVGLYDSISLSDRLFGLVLVPPLAMAYPVDYRRLLWTDYAHVLRTLRFDVGEAISDATGEGALAAYLAPAESNETMLKAYADALASGTVTVEQSPFFALVAVHHVSQALFGEGDGVDDKVKARLAKVLVGQADREALRNVVGYEQSGRGEVIKCLPACYAGTEEGRKKRVEKLQALVGEEGRARLAPLL
ncbi:SPOSA6832_01761, partial [Sporobolomyces salmonicolor]